MMERCMPFMIEVACIAILISRIDEAEV